MEKNCVCTIICSNYIAYARTQYESLKSLGLGYDYFVYVVDAESPQDFSAEPFTVIRPSQLFACDEYTRLAFLFNALELSTNVKPRLLKHLLQNGYSNVLYFDPDIYIYRDIGSIFKHFSDGSILLTPHSLHPYEGTLRPNDQDLLIGGTFNLGFIGVSNSPAARHFLDWWEQRCLQLGYNEVRSGLMVDQKWVNLAPCYFDGVRILKDAGYNVAYWNLHERTLSKVKGEWYVNGQQPLTFYHFSGIQFNEHDQISKHQNRYDLNLRKELIPLFEAYRDRLNVNGIRETIHCRYRYDRFDNGEGISDIARKLYFTYADRVSGDPFSSNNRYYRWLRRNRMVGFTKTNEAFNSMNYDANSIRIKVIHRSLQCLLFVLGPDNYLMLMKYLSYISTVRNQHSVFKYSRDRS